jgi:hypothetical protein
MLIFEITHGSTNGMPAQKQLVQYKHSISPCLEKLSSHPTHSCSDLLDNSSWDGCTALQDAADNPHVSLSLLSRHVFEGSPPIPTLKVASWLPSLVQETDSAKQFIHTYTFTWDGYNTTLITSSENHPGLDTDYENRFTRWKLVKPRY